MKVTLYLTNETDKARQFSKEADGGKPFQRRWIPISAIKYQHKTPCDPYPMCVLEIDGRIGRNIGLEDES